MDNELKRNIAAARSGDIKAFESIYNIYRDRLFFFAKKLTGSRECAEDIVSETFITAMERIGTLREEESFGGWLYSVCYHKCMDQLKSRAVSLPLEENSEVIAGLNEPVMLPEDFAVNDQIKSTLRSIVDGLSPEARTAVILYYYEEMSLSQIAETTGTTENAAKQKLFRARQVIKGQIEKLIGKGALFAAFPLGAVLNNTAELADKAPAAAEAAGAAKLSTGLAVKVAAFGAAALIGIGVPYGLSRLGSGGGYNPEESSITTENSLPESIVSDSSSVKERIEPIKEDRSYGGLFIGNNEILLDAEEAEATFDIIKSSLTPTGEDSQTVMGDNDTADWRISCSVGKESYILDRRLTENGWRISDRSAGGIYYDSPEINAQVMAIVQRELGRSRQTDTQWYSISCEEPSTEAEYVSAAMELADQWLTSLQSEDTEDYYRNTGFTINKEGKCRYLSCGTVDGKKEFAVEICFTAEDCGDGTFYDKYYQEGRYTAAGTFWSGQYICGRFRWDNGTLTLTDFGTRDQSNMMQYRLNGINKSGYKNFYEFARRPDMEQAIEESYVDKYGGYAVSKNLTLTEDGKPINFDIYARKFESEDENSVTAIWDQRTYINREQTCSTGLYFTDNETGHMPDTLPKDFKITFDNYDGDANPDYCCRYMEDENGTYYFIDSIQSDGRIFNYSGRAFTGGVYIAGCFEPSPRLQKCDRHLYTGWGFKNGRYFPTNESGEEMVLPEVNMYSDRYYLPDDMKLYSRDENSVWCFIWNNTGRDITTSGTYSIEINEGGEWKELVSGLTAKAVTVSPRGYAEVEYDISSLTGRKNTIYRIVQKCGQYTAYGSFWCDGEEANNVRISADGLINGSHVGRFTVTDIGYGSFDLNSVKLVVGGQDIPVFFSPVSDEAGKYTYEFYLPRDLPEGASEGTLVINDRLQTDIKLLTDIVIPKVTAELDFGDDVTVTISSDEDISLKEAYISKSINGDYQLLYEMQEAADISAGKTKQVALYHIFYFYNRDIDSIIDALYELYSDEEELPPGLEKLGITKGTTKEEFKEIYTRIMSISEGDEYTLNLEFTCSGINYTKQVKGVR